MVSIVTFLQMSAVAIVIIMNPSHSWRCFGPGGAHCHCLLPSLERDVTSIQTAIKQFISLLSEYYHYPSLTLQPYILKQLHPSLNHQS